MVLIIWSALLFTYHSYHSHRTIPLTKETATVLRVVMVGNVLLATLAYLIPLRQLSRSWFILFGVLSASLVIFEKVLLRIIARYVRMKGLNYRTVLIVGTMTNVCCESSARDAMMMNFHTIMVSDANAAATDEEHNASLINFYVTFGDVMDTDFLIGCLERNAGRRAA